MWRIPIGDFNQAMLEGFGRLAKVQLVGNLATVWALMDFQKDAAVRETTILWEKRSELMRRRFQMDALQKLISAQIEEKGAMG